MRRFLSYLANNHLLANLTMVMVFVGAVLAWNKIGKEEMPSFEFPWLRIQVPYPGASAEDVELLVTKPLEDSIRGVQGILEVTSTSSNGRSSISVELSQDESQWSEIINNIKDATYGVQLPDGIAKDLKFRQFKSSEKAIIDIGVFHKSQELLNPQGRKELQQYILALENHLAAIPEISEVSRSGYREREIKIVLNTKKLNHYRMSGAYVAEMLRKYHFRTPLGSLENKAESRMTLVSEYETADTLKKLVIRSGFEGTTVLLEDIASVTEEFKKQTSIRKVQGHQAIFLRVTKIASTDILTAITAIKGAVQDFKNGRESGNIDMILLDDESADLQNRLNIVSMNGILGFVLILIVLLIFLDLRSGFWVALGLPFCMGTTLIALWVSGDTINNMTLAAVIIVIGIVVDDAIIITESIARQKSKYGSSSQSIVEGTYKVILPILASILTTCVAFVPFAYFEGRFGTFVKSIPFIVALMLGASLYESICILPAHLNDRKESGKKKDHWFFKVESFYSRLLDRILRWRALVIVFFIGLFASSLYLFRTQMKYVMFPREEAREIYIRAATPKGTGRLDTAMKVREIEDIFLEDLGKSVVGVRSSIAQSRWGGKVKDNSVFMRIELLSLEKRGIPLRKLMAKWENKADQLQGFENIRFIKGRFGRGTGSPIDIQILENDDQKRHKIAEMIQKELSENTNFSNAEIERSIQNPEYRLTIKASELEKRGIAPKALADSLKVYVSGLVVYRITSGEEDVEVTLTIPDQEKTSIETVLNFKVENRQGYFIPLRDLLEVKKGKIPANIQRLHYKRRLSVKGDLAENALPPLEIAKQLESGILKQIKSLFPSAIILLKGEIEDSRKSRSDFIYTIIAVGALIYCILTLLYRSIFTPLLIMTIIPFGLVGVVLAFYAHQMSAYGFFAIVGTIGMIGVVINDAIVMIDRLEKDIDPSAPLRPQVSKIAATRLRAVTLTTITTVSGIFPTAYGIAGYDSMLAEMMLAMGWGLAFATVITLALVPCIYTFYKQLQIAIKPQRSST